MLAALHTSYHITKMYRLGSGIQNTGKPNNLLSLMTVCRHDFHDSGMAKVHVTIWLKCVAKAIFVKAIFSCLNLKPDVFLPYNMPKVFNKFGHGLTGTVIVWDEFKPVLYTEYFRE